MIYVFKNILTLLKDLLFCSVCISKPLYVCCVIGWIAWGGSGGWDRAAARKQKGGQQPLFFQELGTVNLVALLAALLTQPAGTACVMRDNG